MRDGHVERLIQLLARIPGLGPRSARRAVLHLIKRKDTLLKPLVQALITVVESVHPCSTCGNLDGQDPCQVCTDVRRDGTQICVVEEVADLWALERAVVFRGRYQVLGGTLSALDGVGPEDLNIAGLISRAKRPEIKEVILALNATVDGQTTAHYIHDCLAGCNVVVSQLAHGVPVGGELDYLDDGTIGTALKSRSQM